MVPSKQLISKYHIVMIKIKIIRHSERLDYANILYWLLCIGQYWSDSPLTSNGHEMAKLKGKELSSCGINPKYIYTSPYCRTMSTATEIKMSFPKSDIVIEPLLAEYQPYYKHNISLYPKGIPTNYNGFETEFKYPESYYDFEKRIIFIISQLANNSNEDIIIITHGEVLKCFANYVQNLYPDLTFTLDNIAYLATLSFEYDIDNKKIIESSITFD